MASARAIRAGAAYIEALLDDTKFVRGIRMLANKTRQVASQLQLGGLFTGAVGGAISAFGLNVLKLAGNAQEVQNRFNAVFNVVQNGRVVFEGFRQDAEEFANLLASAANRSSFQLKDMMSRFQSIVLGFGFARREALTFSKALTRLTLDLASFEDVSDSEAAQKLLSGLAGEIEPVRRAGITINQTTVDAELKRMGVMSTAKGATEAQKATARVTIMLRSMSESFKNATNDVFRTADNFTNIVRGLQGAFYDFRVAVGSTMLVVASQWGKRLTQMLRQATAFVQKFSGLVLLFFKAGLALAILGPAMIIASVALRQFAFWANITANVFTFLNARAKQIVRIALAPFLLTWRAAALATGVAMRTLSLALFAVRSAAMIAYHAMSFLFAISPAALLVGIIGGLAFALARSANQSLSGLKKTAANAANGVASSAKAIATGAVNAAAKVPSIAINAWNGIQRAAARATLFVRHHYEDTKRNVLEVYEAIKSAFLAGDLELAAQIAFTTLRIVWVDALAKMFANLDGWLKTIEIAWIDLKGKLQDAWSGMTPWWKGFTNDMELVWNSFVDRIVFKLESKLESLRAMGKGFFNAALFGWWLPGGGQDNPALKAGNAFDNNQEREKKTQAAFEAGQVAVKAATEEAKQKAAAAELVRQIEKDAITNRADMFKDDADSLRVHAENLRAAFDELQKKAREAAAKAGNERAAAEAEFLKKYGGEGIASPGGFGSGALKTFGTVSGRDARQMFGASDIPQQQLTHLKNIDRNLRRIRGLNNNPQNVKLAVPVVN